MDGVAGTPRAPEQRWNSACGPWLRAEGGIITHLRHRLRRLKDPYPWRTYWNMANVSAWRAEEEADRRETLQGRGPGGFHHTLQVWRPHAALFVCAPGFFATVRERPATPAPFRRRKRLQTPIGGSSRRRKRRWPPGGAYAGERHLTGFAKIRRRAVHRRPRNDWPAWRAAPILFAARLRASATST